MNSCTWISPIVLISVSRFGCVDPATGAKSSAGPHEQAVVARGVVGDDEAGAAVERLRAGARREREARVAALVRGLDDRRQKCRADPAVAELLAHEHVADVAPTGVGEAGA